MASRAGRAVATHKDVARLAGVSTAVVSYVVNGGPRGVSPATEERVRRAIAALDYRPNAAARALKLGSSEMIGMVVPELENPFFAALARAAETSAAEQGYVLLVANSKGSPATEQTVLSRLAGRGVDGVLFCSTLREPDLRELDLAEVPAVLINQSIQLPGHDSIEVDLQGGAKAAVEHLIGHGHRDIALISGPSGNGALDGREIGWLTALERAGLQPGPIHRAPFDREGGFRAGRSLIAGTSRPTAVLASSDLLAIGLLRATHEAGLRVPDDLAIISFDGSAETAYSWPQLSTVTQPIDDIARLAVEALLAGGQEPRRQVLQPGFVARASCGC